MAWGAEVLCLKRFPRRLSGVWRKGVSESGLLEAAGRFSKFWFQPWVGGNVIIIEHDVHVWEFYSSERKISGFGRLTNGSNRRIEREIALQKSVVGALFLSSSISSPQGRHSKTSTSISAEMTCLLWHTIKESEMVYFQTENVKSLLCHY